MKNIGLWIDHEKPRVQIVGIEAADKMTERQIAAKVRNYFQEAAAP